MRDVFRRTRRGSACATVAALAVCGLLQAPGGAPTALGQKTEPKEKYQIYAGSTHAHSSFTWSHGAQWDKAKEGFGDKSAIRVADGTQYPAEHMVLKPDWKKIQGPPAEHFSRAKAQGYDFYTMTDHSQEADFQPV